MSRPDAGPVAQARLDIITAVELRQKYLNDEHQEMQNFAELGVAGVRKDGGSTVASDIELEWASGIMQIRLPGAKPAPTGYSGHGHFIVRNLNAFYNDTKTMSMIRPLTT